MQCIKVGRLYLVLPAEYLYSTVTNVNAVNYEIPTGYGHITSTPLRA
jgi:hypothetical protein